MYGSIREVIVKDSKVLFIEYILYTGQDQGFLMVM